MTDDDGLMDALTREPGSATANDVLRLIATIDQLRVDLASRVKAAREYHGQINTLNRQLEDALSQAHAHKRAASKAKAELNVERHPTVCIMCEGPLTGYVDGYCSEQCHAHAMDTPELTTTTTMSELMESPVIQKMMQDDENARLARDLGAAPEVLPGMLDAKSDLVGRLSAAMDKNDRRLRDMIAKMDAKTPQGEHFFSDKAQSAIEAICKRMIEAAGEGDDV